ncbi:MAG TPA: hypothetical protein PK646_00340 [Bacillota bacterium]|jgi:ribosomal protein L37AE/L43A|nr:hypothetical protein [Bacillota bacterium]HQB80535.1 hypothetical protein [Bacillota bacterium]
MNQLKAKKIKRHILKSYEFWQIDEKFLVVSPDKKLFLQEGLDALPASESGYLAYAYLDDILKVAFLGYADPEQGTYEYFESEDILVMPAAALTQMLVMVVKPTLELNSHPFVQGVLAFHESDALRRSTLALRILDPLRDPLYPGILTACFIRDEQKKRQAYQDLTDRYREKLETAQIQTENQGSLPGLPDVPDDYINFVRIKDLTPANHGTWRAVLMENLPGTRLKKKGDSVAISLVQVTEEETDCAVLFVDHTAPVEGTGITVASHKPSRLPWRLAYELVCTDCSYRDTFYLGRQGEDHQMFKEILDEIRSGRIDPLILIDLVQSDQCELDFSRELYRCRNCGTLEVKRQLRLIKEDKSLSSTYNCPSCGERMSLVKRNQIASIDCPHCRKPLALVSEKQWSRVRGQNQV